MHGDRPKEGQYLFDKPRNVRRLFGAYYPWLAALLLLEPLVHRHSVFPWEEWPGFYAAFGFVACVALVLAAKYVLRPLVMRKEDYYG
ncbi:MAG: hypothetical protein ACUVS3_13820 [Thermodesulfobacteriota bacterium]